MRSHATFSEETAGFRQSFAVASHDHSFAGEFLRFNFHCPREAMLSGDRKCIGLCDNRTFMEPVRASINKGERQIDPPLNEASD